MQNRQKRAIAIRMGCMLVETLPDKNRRVWRSRTAGMILGLAAAGTDPAAGGRRGKNSGSAPTQT